MGIYLLDVVMLAQDHATLGKTRTTNVRKCCLATRTFETCVVPITVQRMQKEPVHNLWATTRTTAIGITSTRWKVLLLLLLVLLHHRMMHHTATHHGVMRRVHHVALMMASRTTVRRGCKVWRLRCGRRGVPLPAYGNQVGRSRGCTHTFDERKTTTSNYGGSKRNEPSQLKSSAPRTGRRRLTRLTSSLSCCKMATNKPSRDALGGA